MSVTIYQGSALARLKELPDESVQCVVTSPPYWGLRAYGGDPGMIGLEPTFEEHVSNLVAVFREVRRVLRTDGTCWLNYGDAYYSRTGPDNGKGLDGKTRGGSQELGRCNLKDGTEYKPKDLMMMPARVALALQADGWWLRSEIIWHKPNPMPESVADRPTSAHEKIYLLTKSAKYFYDAEAVRTKTDRYIEGPYRAMANGSAYVNQDKIPSNDTINKKQRGHARPHEGFQNDWDGRTKEEQQASGANLRNVWTMATYSFTGAHFATFPPELVEKCVKAGTSEKGCCAACGRAWVREVSEPTGGSKGAAWLDHSKDAEAGNFKTASSQGYQCGATLGWSPACQCDADVKPCVVLDPFAGSGTVGLVADRLGRDAILIELNPEYCEMARTRIQADNPLFAEIERSAP